MNSTGKVNTPLPRREGQRGGYFFLLFLPLFLLSAIAQAAAPFITFSKPQGESVCLSQGGTILYDAANDYKGVAIAAENLKTDLLKVTGQTYTLLPSEQSDAASAVRIVVGTIGKSRLIDQLVKAKKIDGKQLKGKCEKFIITQVDGSLIIAGSDKRGTIYGIYELCEQMGVSPWYYWADVPVLRRSEVYALAGSYTDGEPAVRYRGIFLNDEAPCLSGWIRENHGGVYNHEFYAKVFELVLRLRGNFMWPAMWSSSFYADDPLNMTTADDMGVIMGTSHHEPMAKAHQEWRKIKGHGPWNFDTNRDELTDFWRSGVERMKNTEDVVTIGMRGDGDEPMADKPDVALMERIVAHQRKLIEQATGKKAKDVPQVWALYKEVQQYYEKGMRVPDDVILLLCDDNWGNVRMLPTTRTPDMPNPRRHPGGYGMYYHVDYVGAPRNSKFLNVSQVQRMWEQLNLTYTSGIDRLWILNVGDLKPMELPIDFWFKEAWNPSQFNAGNLMAYTERFCAQQFGVEHAKEAARLLNLQCKYAHRRTAEQLAKDTYRLNNGEWTERLLEYKQLEADALALYAQLAYEYQDAYREIILSPVRLMANLYEMYYAQAKNDQFAKQNNTEANRWADRVEECFRKDSLLCAEYNHDIAGGKWNHMMDEIHIGYRSWNNPPRNRCPEVRRITVEQAKEKVLSVPDLNVAQMPVILEAAAFAEKTDAAAARWTVIPDFGIYDSAIVLMPYTEKTDGASITYRFQAQFRDNVTITFAFAPNFPVNDVQKGMRLKYSIDGGEAVTLNTNGSDVIRFHNATGDQQYDWAKERINLRRVKASFPANEDGIHTLTLSPLDPGIVLERITIE